MTQNCVKISIPWSFRDGPLEMGNFFYGTLILPTRLQLLQLGHQAIQPVS